MANLITIEQLLESVDLDFEARWVTKDKNGEIWIWNSEPVKDCNWHIQRNAPREFCGFFITNKIKLSEFDGKDWTECIYEVPRKTDEYEQNLEKLRPADSDLVYRVNLPRKTTGKIKKLECYELADKEFNPTGKFEPMCYMTLIQTINSLVDAVNELKGAKNE